ncbi:MAG: YcgN family cysteine cluster protein [Pseudomonadota bacterium]
MSDELRPRFWERFTLEDLNRAEWEALCDGCAKCCLIKLEDEETDEVAHTSIACRLLDRDTCRCKNYALRTQIVPDCNRLDPASLERIAPWLPRSCAYRRMKEDRGLAAWHPLVSGDPQSPHRAGVSMWGRMHAETEIDEDDWPDFIIEEAV